MPAAAVQQEEAVVWPPVAGSDSITLADVVAFLLRQFWLITGTVAVLLAAAALYALATPAQYVANAQLLIEPAKQEALWEHANRVDATLDNAQVESQVEVLQSERIADTVIAKLGLTDDPEFRSAGTGNARQRGTLDKFENALSARRVGQSYVIQVSFRARDPKKAAQIANAITAAYLQDQQDARQTAAKQASRWLENRITELGSELNNAAAAVQQYRVTHGIVITAGNGQPQLIDKLTELEARASAYRKVYEALVEQLTQNQEQTSYPVSDARVITAASEPLGKTYPKTSLVMLLAIVGGLVVGVAIASARSMLDDTIHSVKQVRDATLGLPVLGTLPVYQPSRTGTRNITRQINVLDSPGAPFCEAMRNVEVSVRNRRRGEGLGALGVVSVTHGDGASAVAFNFAALLAASGIKTLLVDADFRRRGLGGQPSHDVSPALAAEAIVYDPKTSLYVLPSAASGIARADLLALPPGHGLLSTLREKFTAIVVDLPALDRSADARVVAPLLDGCIVVAAHARTPFRALAEATEVLRGDGVALLGIVINRVSHGIQPFLGIGFDEARRFDYAEYVGNSVGAESR